MICSEFDHLLDLYIDGELDEVQRGEIEAHAAQCGICADKLNAARELREILSHMDDDIAVPLPAQAAWRKAVREEANRKLLKKLYTVIGSVAAVCVLTLGVTSMLQREAAEMPGVRVVEADGVSDQSAFVGETVARSAETPQSVGYVERTVESADVDQALAYLKDIAAEYGAVIDREAESVQGVNVFLQVPGENALDFIAAVDSIGSEPDVREYILDQSAATVGICVLIIGA